jgi:hypothetical protein
MDKKPEFQHPDKWLNNLPAYSAEQMIVCDKCERSNAPNRLKCLYCGDELPINDEQKSSLKPRLRKLETWEKAFNIIVLPKELANYSLPDLAFQLRLESQTLEQILKTQKPLPIARAASLEEAGIIKQNLLECGIESITLSDEDLKPEIVTRRLRGLEFNENSLKLNLFNSTESVEIKKSDLLAVVIGGLFGRKIESAEKHSSKEENKLLTSSETSSDEPLIDIYSSDDNVGYRISTNGFDFSCLGNDKKLIASENIKVLANHLRKFNPEITFVDDYVKIRQALCEIWLVDENKSSLGLKTGKFGSYNIENITTINNLGQFTKYSRLQWHLL